MHLILLRYCLYHGVSHHHVYVALVYHVCSYDKHLLRRLPILIQRYHHRCKKESGFRVENLVLFPTG